MNGRGGNMGGMPPAGMRQGPIPNGVNGGTGPQGLASIQGGRGPAPLNGSAGPGARVPPAGAGARPGGYRGNTANQRPVEQQSSAPSLTAAALANATPTEQKQILGETIYPKIHAAQPELAGKITGMLLEMDNAELLVLLEDDAALNAKVNEAITVLADYNRKPAEE